jgi:hypothetical protein
MARRIFDDLSLEVPDGWMNASVVSLVGTDSGVFQPSVVITREEAPSGSLERHAKGLLPAVAKQLRAHRLLGQGPAKVADRPAYRLEHRFETPEGVEVRQTQLFFVLGGDLVVVALTAAAAEHAARKPTLDAIARSVRARPHSEDSA